MINLDLQKEIIEWHKATFTLATLESQIFKWREELEELKKADNYRTYLNELCDCIIVAVGFQRFNESGKILYNTFIEYIKNILDKKQENWDFDTEIINRFVKSKLEINKCRQWKFINNTYHHEG